VGSGKWGVGSWEFFEQNMPTIALVRCFSPDKTGAISSNK